MLQLNREISFLADSSGSFHLTAGVEVSFLRAYGNGSSAPYVDIDAAAGLAAVNAHAWKKGDDVV